MAEHLSETLLVPSSITPLFAEQSSPYTVTLPVEVSGATAVQEVITHGGHSRVPTANPTHA